jgi:uncharacterized coiled-coil DUF342 family protein
MTKGVSALRFLVVLVCLLILVGCEGKDERKAAAEAQEASTSLSEVRGALARAKTEIADLDEELQALRQFRDELERQVKQLTQERDKAIAVAQAAEGTIKNLTAQLDRQAEGLKLLQREFTEVKAIIQEQRTTIAEQQGVIEELEKIIEEQAATEGQQEVVEQPEESVEPDEVVEE